MRRPGFSPSMLREGKGLISLHPEGGSHVHVPFECVCVWTHTVNFLYALCMGLYLKVCAALFLVFDIKGHV